MSDPAGPATTMRTRCDLESFRVVYRDESLVAIHKPAGLLTHRSQIDSRETRFALQMAREAIGRRVYPVHRLDKATSGLLMFALDAESAAALAAQFARQEVDKFYLALVRGWPSDDGSVDKPLRLRRERREGRGDGSNALQAARTEFTRLATASLDHPLGRFAQQRYALLEVRPRSGRRHQIRRHLNHISHPVIGDVNHGDRHHNHLFHHWRGYHRLYLAAVSLRFRHPAAGHWMILTAPLQGDFTDTIEALGLPMPPPATRAAQPADG